MEQLHLWEPLGLKQYECSECRGVGKLSVKIKNKITEIPCGKCVETGLDLVTLKEAIEAIDRMGE